MRRFMRVGVRREHVVLALMLAMTAVAGCIQAGDASGRPDDGSDGEEELPPVDACRAPEPAPETPRVGPEQGTITNHDGSFTYSGQVLAKTGIEHHPWRNDRSAAYVTWGGQSTTGTLRMTVFDACGQVVYDTEKTGPSQGSSVEETSQGEPGDWLLAFEFVGYTAQMGLSVTSAY